MLFCDARRGTLGGWETKTLLYREEIGHAGRDGAAESWGVLSLEELRACGLTDATVAGWVAAGQLHRVHRGVYAVGHRA